MSETILQEAERLVGGDRGNDYGHPSEDFGRTAALWSAYFDFEFTAADVGLAMVLLKLSRERTKRKRDNLVDGAGYLRCVERVYEREDEE